MQKLTPDQAAVMDAMLADMAEGHIIIDPDGTGDNRIPEDFELTLKQCKRGGCLNLRNPEAPTPIKPAASNMHGTQAAQLNVA